MGTPDFAAVALDALLQADQCELVAVYSQPPRPANRGKKLSPSPVHQLAESRGLPVETPLNFKSPDDVQRFGDYGADLAIVAAYGLLLPSSILTAPRLGCVNIHASLLPRWRGAAPIHRAIEHGDPQSGVCLMQMDEGLDTGGVIARGEIELEPKETTPSLHDKLAAMGAQMVVDLVADIAQGQEPSSTAQPDQGITYAKKISKAEARIDWSQPAQVIERQVRAFQPFPGSFFEVQRPGGQLERIKVLYADVLAIAESDGTQPGTHLGELKVACGQDSALQIQRLQRAGKQPVAASEYLNGTDLPAGIAFNAEPGQ